MQVLSLFTRKLVFFFKIHFNSVRKKNILQHDCSVFAKIYIVIAVFLVI